MGRGSWVRLNFTGKSINTIEFMEFVLLRLNSSLSLERKNHELIVRTIHTTYESLKSNTEVTTTAVRYDYTGAL